MKKIWVYLLGILTGIIIMFAVAFFVTRSSNTGYTFFDEPGEIMDARSYTVFQAGDGDALAYENILSDVVVLLWNREGIPYYDNQVVQPGRGECFRQIGIYKYTSQDGTDRTVPIVAIMAGGIDQTETAQVQAVDNHYNFFENPGDVMPDRSYKISRILNDSCVIAKGKGDWHYPNDDFYPGQEVLVLDHRASTFYDGQILKATNGKRFRQIGTYRTEGFVEKVIPIVKLMN